MESEPDLACAQTCQGLLLGELYKSKLEAAGIPALLLYESIGRVFGLTVDGLGQVRVMVPASLLPQAQALLAEIEEQEQSGEEPAP